MGAFHTIKPVFCWLPRDSYPSEKLGNLSGSRDEVRDAAKLLQAHHADVDLQLGDEGTKDAFKKAVQEGHSIVHLAVHALADSKNPSHAALFLLDDKNSGTDGMLDSTKVPTLPSLNSRSRSRVPWLSQNPRSRNCWKSPTFCLEADHHLAAKMLGVGRATPRSQKPAACRRWQRAMNRL